MAAGSPPETSPLNETNLSVEMNAAVLDEGIRSTDGFAVHARVSAVRQGYLHDPFVNQFAPRSLPTHTPLINIGTYVRTTSIDRLVEDFLKVGTANGSMIKKQIVSVGAGSDTRFWRLSVDYTLNFMFEYI